VHSDCDGDTCAKTSFRFSDNCRERKREREKDPTNISDAEKVPLSDTLGVPEVRLFYASPSVLLILCASHQREVTSQST